MTPKQIQRQNHRDKGRYANVNPCSGCGKSAGLDYCSRPLTFPNSGHGPHPRSGKELDSMTEQWVVKFTEQNGQSWQSAQVFESMSEAVYHGITICRLWPKTAGYLRADPVQLVSPCEVDPCLIDLAIASDATARTEQRIAATN